jgi:hypothetical protein
MSIRKFVKKSVTRYSKWVNNHTRILDFLDNDVGWFSAVVTIAGLFAGGVPDIVAAFRGVKNVEEAVEGVETVSKGLEVGKIAETGEGEGKMLVGKIGVTAKDSDAAVASKYAGIASKLNFVADVTGMVGGVAQFLQGTTYGVNNGGILNSVAGIVNAGLSFTDIKATQLEKDMEKAEKVSEATKSDKDIEKYKMKKQAYETYQSRSDNANFYIGTVASIGVGVYDTSTGSKGQGAATIAYGAGYYILSKPSEIGSVGLAIKSFLVG